MSDSGVGAVLLQRSLANRKLHPCAFFSRCLSRAERNYDVGNRRLLALILAFQEWRHRLEGSVEPFVVWTDHKNLAYLHGVKRLNSRQALWALFLGCLNFTLTYDPGSKNIKPDALSCQCATNWTKQEPGPILPSTCVVGLATWQIEERIREAQHSVPIPGGVPPDSLFVPMAAQGPAVGSLVQTGMPPRSKTYPAPQHQGLHRRLSCECPWEVGASAPCRSAPPAADSTSPLVSYRGRFRHWPPPLRGTHGDPDCGGPLLQGCTLRASPQNPIGSRDRQPSDAPCLLPPRFSPGHRL